ncbi:hypothetical protein Tco_0327045 [Tanacetum coccineum]
MHLRLHPELHLMEGHVAFTLLSNLCHCASTLSNANDNVSNEHVGPSNAAKQDGYFTCYRRCEFDSQLKLTEMPQHIRFWYTTVSCFSLGRPARLYARLIGKVQVGTVFMSKGDNEVDEQEKTYGRIDMQLYCISFPPGAFTGVRGCRDYDQKLIGFACNSLPAGVYKKDTPDIEATSQ